MVLPRRWHFFHVSVCFPVSLSLPSLLHCAMLSMDFCFWFGCITSIENRNKTKRQEPRIQRKKSTLKFQRQRKPFKHCALTDCIAFKVATKKAVWNSKISCSMFVIVLNLHMNELRAGNALRALNVRCSFFIRLLLIFITFFSICALSFDPSECAVFISLCSFWFK